MWVRDEAHAAKAKRGAQQSVSNISDALPTASGCPLTCQQQQSYCAEFTVKQQKLTNQCEALLLNSEEITQSTRQHGEMLTGTAHLRGAPTCSFRNLTINISYRYFCPLKPLFDRQLLES